MGDQTKIEWCDSTFNGWMGCTKVSPACDHCYAAVSTPVRTKGIAWGAGQPRQRTSAANWQQPRRWNEAAGRRRFVQCDGCGRREFRKWDNTVPPGGLACCSTPGCTALPESDSQPVRPRVFCASLADWLDNEVPIEWLVDLLDLIRRTPNLNWLLLTKRVGNWRWRVEGVAEYLRAHWPAIDASPLLQWVGAWLDGDAPVHVWLGATVVNQEEADRDVPKLLQVPARVRFLSVEPMLGPIQLTSSGFIPPDDEGPARDDGRSSLWPTRAEALENSGIHWVIAGGESGPHARPMHPDWVRSLRDQCAAAGIPFLFKQWGDWVPVDVWPNDHRVTAIMLDGSTVPHDVVPQDVGGHRMHRVGKKAAGNLLDGRQHLEWPI